MKPVQLLLAASLICLSACATARFDDPLRALERTLDGAGVAGGLDGTGGFRGGAAARGGLSVGPSVADYSPGFQAQLAEELEAMAGRNPAVWRALLDYGELRAALSAR